MLEDDDNFSLDDLQTYESDAIVMSYRLEAERCRRKIESEEARLDRLEHAVFRRIGFLHTSARRR